MRPSVSLPMRDFYFFGLVYDIGSTEGLSITAYTSVVESYFLLSMLTWAIGNP